MVTNVVLICLDGNEELMPIIHHVEQLPMHIRLVSMDKLIIRYFEMFGLLRNGSPIYYQLLFKPSEPCFQP